METDGTNTEEGGEAANPDGHVYESLTGAEGQVVGEEKPAPESFSAATSPSEGQEEKEPPAASAVKEGESPAPAAAAADTTTVVPPAATVSAADAAGGAEKAAADALAEAYKALDGIVPSVIRGSTVAEVKASLEEAKQAYATVKASVLKEQGAAVPGAHGGPAGVDPLPTTPFGMILAGLNQISPAKGGRKQ